MSEDTDHIRVLVIEGSRNVRDFVAEQVLAPNGYDAILAGDGVEGLRLALAEIPDLILMEYELPLMSGRDVLESLHARPLQIPVILMISHGAEQIAVRLIRMGVRDYIVKPFTADDLLQSIKRAIFEVHLRRDKAHLTRQLAMANRKIRQCLVELGILARIGTAVTNQMPLAQLLERIADATLFITHSEECVLILNDPETGQRTEKVAKRRIQGIARPLIPTVSPDPDRPGAVAAMLHIPLQVGAKEIGVLSVHNKTMPRSFSDHERQMLHILAGYAAIAIENAHRLHQVEQARTEEGSPVSD
jgi:two-component system NtrC family sensor kinase